MRELVNLRLCLCWSSGHIAHSVFPAHIAAVSYLNLETWIEMRKAYDSEDMACILSWVNNHKGSKNMMNKHTDLLDLRSMSTKQIQHIFTPTSVVTSHESLSSHHICIISLA